MTSTETVSQTEPEKEQSEIARRLQLGLAKALLNSEKAYYGLDALVFKLLKSEDKKLREDITEIEKSLYAAKVNLRKSFNFSQGEFSLANFKELHEAYTRLSKTIPSIEETDDLVDRVMRNLDRTKIGKRYMVSKRITKGFGYLAAGLSLGAFTIGAYLPGSIFAGAAITGLWPEKEKSDATILFTNLSFWLGKAGYLPFVKGQHFVLGSYPSNIILASTVLTSMGWVVSNYSFMYLGTKFMYTSQLKKIRKANEQFDYFLLGGIAIREGYRNLAYIDRVMQSEKRTIDRFQPQIDKLEQTLLDYVQGNASYEDVLAARIKYVPDETVKVKYRREKPVESEPTKIGYTAKEYQEMREAQEAEENVKKRKRKHKHMPPSKEREDISVYEPDTPQLQFVLSSKLNEWCTKRNTRVEGYGVTTLVDITREKIELLSNDTLKQNGFVGFDQLGTMKMIRDKEGGENFLLRLRKQHDIPANAIIYRMQPIGSLRAIFATYNHTVQLLEIMPHAEYDRWMKPV
jgi:hypothetical protein